MTLTAGTEDFYARRAAEYAASSRGSDTRRLQTFLSRLKPGSTILELGCGAGLDSSFMLAAGFDVTPSDGSPEMAREAERNLGRPVRILPFATLAEQNAFDGVWANACLLHVSRPDLSDVLGRILRALRPGGLFYASYKTGKSEGNDRYGRYYNYPPQDWLSDIYHGVGWCHLDIEHKAGGGYGGERVDWIHVLAEKSVERHSGDQVHI